MEWGVWFRIIEKKCSRQDGWNTLRCSEGWTVNTDDRGDDNNQVDENLRRVFEKTLSEELPDRFKDLLNQLRDGRGVASDDTSDPDK